MEKKKRRWFVSLLSILIFLVGAGIMFYPTISDLWNKYRNAQLITTYDEAVQELSKENYDQLWAQAREYNSHITVNNIVDAFEENSDYKLSHPYDTVLDPNGDGLMGSIDIPKIGVKIAIYHGLGKTALEKGCGHVEGTGLPIGGKSNHAALAAHRGLPSARLFTDLDQMEAGDIFILNILGEKLVYEVDQIKTVLPHETEDLAIVEGEDLVTLITCTPYAVNTHRLLVRGKRTRYAEKIEEAEKAAETVPEKIARAEPQKLLLAGIGVFFVSVIILYFVVRRWLL